MSAEEQTTRPDKGAKRPSRHAKIMRGVVTPIFGLLAVAAVVLGYMNATMWKPSTEITASATMSGSRYVVTDPNVLTLLDQNATITVDSGSSQDEACVALGSSKDVAGWVASEKSYTRITGLTSWSELSTQKGSSTSQGAPTSADDAVSFKDSDMWTAVKCGTGSVSLKSKKTGASTVAIVDLGENVTNAKVQLHWVRSEVPDFAMPFYLSGGLLAVLAVLCASVFAMPPHKRRKRMVEGMASAVIPPASQCPGSRMVQVDVIVAVTPHIGVRAVRPRNPRNLKPPKHRLSSTQVRVTWSPTSRPVPKAALSPASAPAITNRLR